MRRFVDSSNGMTALNVETFRRSRMAKRAKNTVPSPRGGVQAVTAWEELGKCDERPNIEY